ncbi:LysR family transcriptional regulator [Sporolactobacillus putidus]|uniref:LysR family transcriptional regulator n=1 Tax=Sporolactobacillus putidus TaxID=492735 RepID=A0A917W0X7_9BACL|nr:LysR family transcriptional regulator [Sporolactobacillus putidus]GGL53935.1 LysR family transcriptional regulator [Sporolactobacillus putidus]
MTFRHLQIFITVCDKLNMTAAAESLFLSQPAVSQAISELEKHFGVRLFERLSKKLYLTKAGESLLYYARHIVQMNYKAEKEMRSLSKRNYIRIGASVTIGAYILPKLILKFKELSSESTIEVIEDNTTKIEKLILRDQLDLALVEGETTSTDLIKKSFMEDELVLICSPRHRFAAMTSVNPHELETEPFIVREEESGTRKKFEEVMAEKELSWHASWTCNNVDSIKMAVAAGLGVSVISKFAVINEACSGHLCYKKIDGLHFNRHFKMIYHKDKYLSPTMQRFIKLCYLQD